MLLTLFSSNTLKTREANLVGSPWGKNCLYILMKPWKKEKSYINYNNFASLCQLIFYCEKCKWILMPIITDVWGQSIFIRQESEKSCHYRESFSTVGTLESSANREISEASSKDFDFLGAWESKSQVPLKMILSSEFYEWRAITAASFARCSTLSSGSFSCLSSK